MTNAEKVEDYKIKGNAALKEGNAEEAIKYYSEGISLEPENHFLYSNRSAAYCKNNDFESALDDSETVIRLKPDWVKGHVRKGQALGFLYRHEEAMEAYNDGLQHDPNNEQLHDGVKHSKSQLEGPAESQPLMNPFQNPELWKILEENASTREYLKDPGYKAIVQSLHHNPKDLGKYMQDPRVMNTLGVLLGVNLTVVNDNNSGPTSASATPSSSASTNHSAPRSSQAKKTEEPMDISDSESQALQEKEKGNAAYKKKDFTTALVHYHKAIELDPVNLVFRNNEAAVYFEQGEFEKCIKVCEEAVEVGREHRADFKIISKSLARIGNAYSKQEDYTNSIIYYNKSLSEFRDPQITQKVKEIEKKIKEQDRLAYIDVDRSLDEKKLGNTCFQKGDYPGALKHYTEAIQRNPEDAKIFSNRAACYTKVAEFNMALKDSEECIRLDPAFVKGYLRKGASLIAMKNHAMAGLAYQKAMEIDATCQEAIDGYRRSLLAENSDPDAVRQRAMQNPEVQAILADPAMQLILQQMQKEPKALQEHLKNPDIAQKIEKLLECGLIGFR